MFWCAVHQHTWQKISKNQLTRRWTDSGSIKWNRLWHKPSFEGIHCISVCWAVSGTSWLPCQIEALTWQSIEHSMHNSWFICTFNLSNLTNTDYTLCPHDLLFAMYQIIFSKVTRYQLDNGKVVSSHRSHWCACLSSFGEIYTQPDLIPTSASSTGYTTALHGQWKLTPPSRHTNFIHLSVLVTKSGLVLHVLFPCVF